MQLPSSEKSYMPTLVNVVMNSSDAKMVEKVGVATIVVNKAAIQKTRTSGIKVEHTEKRSKSRQQGMVSIPLQEQRKAHNGLENNSEDLVADILEKS